MNALTHAALFWSEDDNSKIHADACFNYPSRAAISSAAKVFHIYIVDYTSHQLGEDIADWFISFVKDAGFNFSYEKWEGHLPAYLNVPEKEANKFPKYKVSFDLSQTSREVYLALIALRFLYENPILVKNVKDLYERHPELDKFQLLVVSNCLFIKGNKSNGLGEHCYVYNSVKKLLFSSLDDYRQKNLMTVPFNLPFQQNRDYRTTQHGWGTVVHTLVEVAGYGSKEYSEARIEQLCGI